MLKRTLYSKCAPTNCQSPSICINGFDTFGCTSSVIGLLASNAVIKWNIYCLTPPLPSTFGMAMAIDSFGNYANQKVLENCIKIPIELSTTRLSIIKRSIPMGDDKQKITASTYTFCPEINRTVLFENAHTHTHSALTWFDFSDFKLLPKRTKQTIGRSRESEELNCDVFMSLVTILFSR